MEPDNTSTRARLIEIGFGLLAWWVTVAWPLASRTRIIAFFGTIAICFLVIQLLLLTNLDDKSNLSRKPIPREVTTTRPPMLSLEALRTIPPMIQVSRPSIQKWRLSPKSSIYRHQKNRIGDDTESEEPERVFHELAICTVFRDEAPFLREWLEFHILEGVQHFYLYNDNSQDDYLRVLAKGLTAGVVTVVDWPLAAITDGPTDTNSAFPKNYDPHLCNTSYYSKDPQALNNCQIAAFNHCLQTFASENNWMMFIDIDEFAFTTTEGTNTTIAQELQSQSSLVTETSIGLVSSTFGSSGRLWSLPMGMLVTNNYRRRSAFNYEDLSTPHIPEDVFRAETFKIKSIVRPSRVSAGRCGSHLFTDLTVSDRSHVTTVATDGKFFKGCGDPWHDPTHCLLVGCSVLKPEWEKMRFNHYRTRSFEDYVFKLEKGIVQGKVATKFNVTKWSFVDRNEDIDLSVVGRISVRLDELHKTPVADEVLKALTLLSLPQPAHKPHTIIYIVGPDESRLSLVSAALTAAGGFAGFPSEMLINDCDRYVACSPANYPIGWFGRRDIWDVNSQLLAEWKKDNDNSPAVLLHQELQATEEESDVAPMAVKTALQQQQNVNGPSGSRIVMDQLLCKTLHQWLKATYPSIVILVADSPEASAFRIRAQQGSSFASAMLIYQTCLTHVLRTVHKSWSTRFLFVDAHWDSHQNFSLSMVRLVDRIDAILKADGRPSEVLLAPSLRRLSLLYQYNHAPWLDYRSDFDHSQDSVNAETSEILFKHLLQSKHRI